MTPEDAKAISERLSIERNKEYLASWGIFISKDERYRRQEELFCKKVDKQYSEIPVFDIIHGKFDSVIPKTKSKKTIFINENLPIIKVALSYGLKIKGNKSVCPFHADKDPSLSFYPNTNSFFCFGCRIGGDVITFIQKIEDLQNG